MATSPLSPASSLAKAVLNWHRSWRPRLRFAGGVPRRRGPILGPFARDLRACMTLEVT